MAYSHIHAYLMFKTTIESFQMRDYMMFCLKGIKKIEVKGLDFWLYLIKPHFFESTNSDF